MELPQQRVFVAGHNGMVGSAIVRALERHDATNILTADRSELDLTDQMAVQRYVASERPDVIIIAAAKVGGIHANNTYPAEFIHENLLIESHLIHAAHQNGCKRLLFLGSSCIYPRMAEQPMRESALLSGYLEATNEPYAIAKIAGIKLCESYNRQYGTDFRSLMPTNLYGIGDNFHSEDSHVIPALMRRFHNAKCGNSASVAVWGTGSVRREFLNVDDLAEACLHVLGLPRKEIERVTEPMVSHLNVGTGVDVSIGELADTMRRVVGYTGEMEFDASKPDGTPRKLLDVSKLQSLGWQSRVPLEEGLRATYAWYLEHQDQVRH